MSCTDLGPGSEKASGEEAGGAGGGPWTGGGGKGGLRWQWVMEFRGCSVGSQRPMGSSLLSHHGTRWLLIGCGSATWEKLTFHSNLWVPNKVALITCSMIMIWVSFTPPAWARSMTRKPRMTAQKSGLFVKASGLSWKKWHHISRGRGGSLMEWDEEGKQCTFVILETRHLWSLTQAVDFNATKLYKREPRDPDKASVCRHRAQKEKVQSLSSNSFLCHISPYCTRWGGNRIVSDGAHSGKCLEIESTDLCASRHFKCERNLRKSMTFFTK